MLLFTEYILLAIGVIIISIYLSKYVDALDKKTKLSGAFIGGIMLAAVTSLPELFTSITAVVFLNQYQLVQGNVFGSNLFNLTIIGICVLIFANRWKQSAISKIHSQTVVYAAIMFTVCFGGMFLPETYMIPLAFTRINIASLIIALIYIINLKSAKEDASCESKEQSDIPLTVKQILFRFAVLAFILIFVSMLLTNVTDRLAEELEFGKTAAGAVFLGVATSLPELTASLNLARLKNFNASIGNITGSNLFNFTILSLSDIFYNGNIYAKDTGAITLIIFGLFSSFLTLLTIRMKKLIPVSIILSILLIVSYISSIIISM